MKKSTQMRALLMSGLAMLLTVSMLIGTTFAWFTDSVESGRNQIVAGNLDIELYRGLDTTADEVDGDTELFKLSENQLWEPGAMVYENLTVANVGNLTLKYQLGVNFTNATQNANGDTLAKVLKVAVVEGGITDTMHRQDLEELDYESAVSFIETGKLFAGGADVYGIVIWWEPSDIDNEFNMNNGATTVMSIDIGVKLFATQAIDESDSFGDDYDGAAPWLGNVDIDWYIDDPDATSFTLSSAEELAGLAAIVNGTATAPATTYGAESDATVKNNFKGKTIYISQDIDLDNMPWTPIGDNANPFLGNIDGQGHTIYNLNVENEGWAGFIGHAGKSSGTTIQNLNVKNATIKSNRMAGAIVGQIYGSIYNCHVENVTILVTPNADGSSYDNGDKVGGIVGWLGDNGNNRVISDCSATNVKLTAYRDVGGIAGYVASSTTVKDNTVIDYTIKVDQQTNHYEEKDANAGAIVGRANGTVTLVDNEVAGETQIVSAKYIKNGLVLAEDNETEGAKLYLVPEDYEAETLAVPEGVTSIGNYAFAYNTNVKTVTLPTTVTDLGRGFDSSAVEKVVLNEGLEVISSRAFRSTTALKEVVISSTVKEIADNAFQKTTLKTIVIPANVETIGETAFGASLIESVIFEGDIEIQGYAFRGCTKLRTVYMKGDVDFVASTLNGRNSCWFCNGESNNPNTSSIIFTVTSEDVKAKVLTGMGAEKNNTPVSVVDKFVEVETAAELLAALESNTCIILTANIEDVTVKLPATLANVTLKAVNGATLKNSTISAADGNSYSYVGLTFDGITFDNSRILMTGWRNGEETIKDLTITNCVFKNLYDTTNTAPVHINKDAAEAVENFTFTNNVIDGATGGSKSGVYAQITGKVVFTGNVINNVSFRPYVIQITTDDGIADEFIVKGNTFSGSSVGRAQGLGNNAEGTDTVKLVVSGNIFKGITDSQQICYWNFNDAKTKADLSKNYYDIDIAANPSRIYYNRAAASVDDLVEMGVYPIYTELNADGTINTASLKTAP